MRWLLLLFFSVAAQAKTLTYSCDWAGWNLIFSTDVTDDATEVQRVYDIDPETTIFIRVGDISAGSTWAAVSVARGRKSQPNRAFCVRGE